MSGTPMRPARLALAVALVVPTFVFAAGQTSVAAPTEAEVQAARAEAEEIGHDLEVAIEAYNELRVRLQGVQDKLAEALHDKRTAEALAAEAMGQLEDRAVAAYTGAGSQMDVLLGASNLSEFSDRLEFMGALAQNDADLASAAQNARQQAEWAAGRYSDTIDEKQRELDSMAGTRAEIERMLAEQRALVDQLDREYREYVERQEAAAAAAAAAEQAAEADTGGSSGSGDTSETTASSCLLRTRPRRRSRSPRRTPRSAPSTCGALPVPTRSTVPGSPAGPTRRQASTCRTHRRRRPPTRRCRTAQPNRETCCSSTTP